MCSCSVVQESMWCNGNQIHDSREVMQNILFYVDIVRQGNRRK